MERSRQQTRASPVRSPLAFAFLLLFFFTFLLLAVLSGCVGQISSASDQYTMKYAEELRNRQAFENGSEECKTGKCWCLVCENGTMIFSGARSMLGKGCFWERDCNSETFNALWNGTKNPSWRVRAFMFGQGPTITDFANANVYCNNRLGMAVNWLVATNVTPYQLPDAGRAICLISKDVTPLYVLYSGGQNINISRTQEIATILGTRGKTLIPGLSSGPVGPVIVTTEMNYNVSQANLVADQIRAIDSYCGNDRPNNKIYCMIALAPRMGDVDAVEAVLTNSPDVADKVDLIAYGIDSRYINSSCNVGKIMAAAQNFSAYSLYFKGKPTIIPYVLFDAGSEDIYGSCVWTDTMAKEAYRRFFISSALSLSQRGVIGVAPYAFNTTSGTLNNPLNCTDCKLGRTDSRLRTWYASCQRYTQVTTKMTGPGGVTLSNRPSPGMLIRFPSQPATSCDENYQLDAIFRGFTFGSGPGGRDFLSPLQPPLEAPTNKVAMRCDVCLVRSVTPPFKAIAPVSNIDQSFCPGPNAKFPELDAWAEQRGLDKYLVRAFVASESNFDPCATARVAPGTFCYGYGYSEMHDPGSENNCEGALEANTAPDAKTNPDHPKWRLCGLGLMQSLEPPYNFWPPEFTGGQFTQYFDVFYRNNQGMYRNNNEGLVSDNLLALAQQCNPKNFNPFRVEDSACMGTMKLEQNLKSAQDWIDGNRLYLNWKNDPEKDAVLGAWIAANKYVGVWDGPTKDPVCLSNGKNKRGDCIAYKFRESWQITSEYCGSEDGLKDTDACKDGQPRLDRCYGYQDFLAYTNDCEKTYFTDYGIIKMNWYFGLLNKCDQSSCPEWKMWTTNAEQTVTIDPYAAAAAKQAGQQPPVPQP